MKKIIILFLLILTTYANAQEYEYFCSQNTAKKTFSGFLASTSGFNLLTRNIAENTIEKAIKKETGAKFKVKINNFHSSNFLSGEFKNLNAQAKKYEYNGIYLSNLNVNTICSYNYIEFINSELYFKENMALKFSAQLTKEELKKTINSGKLNKKLAKILTKISKNENMIAIINSILPITLPVEIDKNNKGHIKIAKVNLLNNILAFESYILIPKNK